MLDQPLLFQATKVYNAFERHGVTVKRPLSIYLLSFFLLIQNMMLSGSSLLVYFHCQLSLF